jgi:uncharacterized RDD family membrane protein YckC
MSAHYRRVSREHFTKSIKIDRMYCSNCGAEMHDATCMSCQRSLPPSARGTIDLRTGFMLAGWWRRFGQVFADTVILVAPSLLVFSLFDEWDGFVIGSLVALCAQGVYFVKFLSGVRGQTLGNRVAASRVRDANTGKRITGMQAFRRWAFVALYAAFVLGPYPVGQVAFYVAVLVDCLFPLWDPRKQTLHDKFAGTIVVVA